MKVKKKIKRKYYFLITMLLIFFLFIILFNSYSVYAKRKINIVSGDYIQKLVFNSINESVNSLFVNSNVENILSVHQKKNEDILFVDYNLNKSYELLNSFSLVLKEKISNISSDDNGIIKLPVFISSNNPLIANFSPKITIKFNFVNSLLSNIKTKITNYGINNALVEVYISVFLETRVITPVNSETKNINYDVLIASQIINGRVPTFYGDYLSQNSSIFDIPIN